MDMKESLINRDAVIDWWLWWLAFQIIFISFRNAFATDETLLLNAKIIGAKNPRHARGICIIGCFASVAWLGVAAFMSYKDRNVIFTVSGLLPAIVFIGSLLVQYFKPFRKR